MPLDSGKLDFAYKYPFSSEAKELVQAHGNEISIKYLDMSAKHIENALSSSLAYKDISIGSVKLDYVMTYLYSRMLLSALRRTDLIRQYSAAEARRSSQALGSNTDDMVAVASQLGIKLTGTFDAPSVTADSGELTIGFADYVRNIPKMHGFELVNQHLSNGVVVLGRNNAVKLLERAIEKAISKSLPLKSTDLPKQVLSYSKTVRFKSAIKADARSIPGKRTEGWIEKLLQTPIADVRHRTVNLILAPYLVNTKGLDVDTAGKIIIDYIERCKQIDPDTKVNDRYVLYQCNYAKRRGLKPLSLERAKELLGEQVDLEVASNAAIKKK